MSTTTRRIAPALLLLFFSLTSALPDEFLIGCAKQAPSCAPYWAAKVPDAFDVTIGTTRGPLNIHVDTAAAPPMAARFYLLASLGYFEGGPWYRVLNLGPDQRFVAQFGYRASPAVDSAWLSLQLSNTTAKVALSNTRGMVAFGTNEVVNSGKNPDCSARLCSQGFSVELFVNLADNSASLDSSDFSPFGTIDAAGMAIVDALYAGYGECSDECASAGDGDPFCVKSPGGGWAGVNLTQMLSMEGGGKPYLQPFNLLDYVTTVSVATVPRAEAMSVN